MGWDGYPLVGLDSHPPLYFLIRVRKIYLSKKLAGLKRWAIADNNLRGIGEIFVLPICSIGPRRRLLQRCDTRTASRQDDIRRKLDQFRREFANATVRGA